MEHINFKQHILRITENLGLKIQQVEATAKLLDEGATIPFIARYRKELTHSLDEVAITNIRDQLKQLKDLDDRKESILASLKERNLLTEELNQAILNTDTLSSLEDIYQPFKPKRRTKATIAKEKGLEPLADYILENQAKDFAIAAEFINHEKEVSDIEAALNGARDIIAEKISDDASARQAIRKLIDSSAQLTSQVIKDKQTEGIKFKDYFQWSEPLNKAPSHRILAIRRGEHEGFLHMHIEVDETQAIQALNSLFINANGPNSLQVKESIQDGYRRLLSPSMETEARVRFKEKADIEAIKVFSENLRELLLASPLGQKTVLAIDPGFRTGCKVVCLDAQGQLLHHDVIYLQTERQIQEASLKIIGFCKQFNIQAIAIGNGTASRETENFIRKLQLPASPIIASVNESGASIYSASQLAREEFPNHDITVRGAVSIGRRLMDPLAELVKLDPKSIGVGQYQHDVDQTLLKDSLEDIVKSCVNSVGVELNTASKELLSYISGLNTTIAANIVNYRNQNGPFSSREILKKVPRLGPKAFEQAAGFLRIRDSLNPLDTSAVHPESYTVVEKMAADQKCSVLELLKDSKIRHNIKLENYITEKVGLPTLKDILEELAKPGRDPRKQFEVFNFLDTVHCIEDLKIGMKLPGIITNVTAFGAFVDIGVHQDGLIHISQLSDTFIKEPSSIVKVQQKVQVTVIELDIPRKRISLSMKNGPIDKKVSFETPKAKTEPSKSFANFNSDWFSQALTNKK